MRKRTIIITILSCLGGLLFWHLSLEPLYTPTALPSAAQLTHFPRHIAHKASYSGKFPPHTFNAIQETLTSYAEGLEVDVRFSKDHVPFLYHGDRLENETNGCGCPEEQPWKTLQKLTYKADGTSKLVRLDDFLKLVGGQKFIFLEIKTNKIFNYNFASSIIKLITKYGLQRTVIVESFNPFFLTTMRLQDRRILLMYDFVTKSHALGEEQQSQFNQIPYLLKQPFFQKQIRRMVRPDILGPRFNTDPKLLKNLIQHGYPLIVWTVDDPKTMKALFELGVKGVQTNKAEVLMKQTPSGPQAVYDAGGTQSFIGRIIHVQNTQDIVKAIERAKCERKKITIAGRRHSMGGQTLLNNAIQLNIMGLDFVSYNAPKKTVTVGAGATWQKVQDILGQYGRCVKVMQSDNIFTVSGSVSVNVHGWQVKSPPMADTILSLKVITADGRLRHINRQKNGDLFRAIIGGYGLFGVITEVELETVPNVKVRFQTHFMNPQDFTKNFSSHVTNNPNTELAYGRLSVDKGHLFEEIGLFWYEKISNQAYTTVTSPESFVALKRGILRASQYFEFGKKLRWTSEKIYVKMLTKEEPVTRSHAMNTDIHVLWPLYGQNKDILHEYFIPKNKLSAFLECLKKRIIAYDMNILNVTVREVLRDKISLLSYAQQDVFGLVCLFSQKNTPQDEESMRQFTQKVIDDVLRLEGCFYLPYRLHYHSKQLLKAYPDIKEWQCLKNKWDPEYIFDSQFFHHIRP